MNCLVLRPADIVSDTEARVLGEEARRVQKVHDLKEGLKIRAAVLGGKLGTAAVRSLSEDEIVLDIKLTEEPLARSNLSWIVAISRPQTIKKLLQLAATLGIDELHLIRTSQVVKSYLQSACLEPENIAANVLKGLEQAGDSIAPRVFVHKFFKPFILEVLPAKLRLTNEATPVCVIADTLCLSGIVPAPGIRQSCIIAIGPESGWGRDEVSQFENIGFHPITLGGRLMRVDTACVYLTARIEALRKRD